MVTEIVNLLEGIVSGDLIWVCVCVWGVILKLNLGLLDQLYSLSSSLDHMDEQPSLCGCQLEYLGRFFLEPKLFRPFLTCSVSSCSVVKVHPKPKTAKKLAKLLIWLHNISNIHACMHVKLS